MQNAHATMRAASEFRTGRSYQRWTVPQGFREIFDTQRKEKKEKKNGMVKMEGVRQHTVGAPPDCAD
jgi:hypothetical protein